MLLCGKTKADVEAVPNLAWKRCGPFKRRCAVVCFSIDQSAAAARGCYAVGCRPFGEKLIFSQNAYDRQTFTRRERERLPYAFLAKRGREERALRRKNMAEGAECFRSCGDP